MTKELERKSKWLSKLLRHQPEDLTMDKNGWVPIKDILNKLDIDLDTLYMIVSSNDKQRFIIDKNRIRANQGHSIPWVEIELSEPDAPNYLYHGTSTDVLSLIYENGLKKMQRQHVHLSDLEETAKKVGMRHARNIEKLVVLKIDARKMKADGIKIYRSENGVWLVDEVKPCYLIENLYY
jgi:putative RNA 2'-phosphotransferase